MPDINYDGYLDIVTGRKKEEVTERYVNPGPRRVKGQRPRVIIGKTPNVEDGPIGSKVRV